MGASRWRILTGCLCPPLPSPPRPRYRAARALARPASTANLPTSPSCVVAADSLFASQSRETPGFESIASSDPASSNPPMPRRRTGTTEAKRRRPAISCPGRRARAPAEGRRLGGEGSGGRKPLGILIGLCPPLPSPPRPRYRAARALARLASTANLPTSPSCVVAADSLFASQSRETPGFESIASSDPASSNPPMPRRRTGTTEAKRRQTGHIVPRAAGSRAGRRPAIGWRGERWAQAAGNSYRLAPAAPFSTQAALPRGASPRKASEYGESANFTRLRRRSRFALRVPKS